MMVLGNTENVNNGIYEKLQSQHRIKNIKQTKKVTLQITVNLIT